MIDASNSIALSAYSDTSLFSDFCAICVFCGKNIFFTQPIFFVAWMKRSGIRGCCLLDRFPRIPLRFIRATLLLPFLPLVLTEQSIWDVLKTIGDSVL